MVNMEDWIKKSKEIANGDGYLDKLSHIYPAQSNKERTINPEDIVIIKKAYDISRENKSYIELINKLLDLDRFPIDDPYISMFRRKRDLIENNPNTVKRIGEIITSMDWDSLLKEIRKPKSASRQMGNSFKKWLQDKYKFICYTEFKYYKSDDLVFLKGSDSILKKYVNDELNIGLSDTKKGLDVLFRKNRRFCFGEAKFITDSGGTQTNQLNLALEVLNDSREPDVYSFAILDGIVWFDGNYIKKINERKGQNIITAILFDEFVQQF